MLTVQKKKGATVNSNKPQSATQFNLISGSGAMRVAGTTSYW